MEETPPQPPQKLVLLKAHEGKRQRAKNRDDAIDGAESELYEASTSLLRDLMFFGDIDPEMNPEQLPTSIPPAWVKECGVRGAERRFRLCLEAWKPSSRVAAGVMVAKHVFTSMHKSRSEAKRPKVMNLNLIQMNQPPRVYPELDVTDREK